MRAALDAMEWSDLAALVGACLGAALLLGLGLAVGAIGRAIWPRG